MHINIRTHFVSPIPTTHSGPASGTVYEGCHHGPGGACVLQQQQQQQRTVHADCSGGGGDSAAGVLLAHTTHRHAEMRARGAGLFVAAKIHYLKHPFIHTYSVKYTLS